MNFLLHLLGPPYAEVAGQRRELPVTKPAQLLYFLACRGDWVGRDELAALIRPDAEEPSARAHLRLLLTRARKFDWAADLQTETHRVRWVVDNDVQRLRVALGRGDWIGVIELYGGGLLEGSPATDLPGFEAWLEAEREALRGAWRTALQKQAESYRLEGENERAAELLERLWQDNPLAEDVLQDFLKAAYLAGRREAALRAFRSFCESLKKELDLEPLEATQTLAELILRAEPLDIDKAPPIRQVPLELFRPPVLVGRSQELAQMRALGGHVLVAGEPGVGKSRLVAEAAPAAGWVKCQEGLENVPYFPVSRLVRQHLPLPESLGSYLDDLARLVPEVRPGRTPPLTEPETAKARLLEALAQLLGALSEAWVFDDLQWADPATLELFGYLAVRPQPRIYGVYRSTETSPRLERLLGGLISSGHLVEIRLSLLGQEAMQALLASLIGEREGPPVFSRWLHARSGGNPFFALETLKALFETGALEGAGRWRTPLDSITQNYAELEVPPVVAEVIRRRVNRLGDEARRVLEAASVLGQGFTPQLLSSISALSEWAVSEALAQAEGRELLDGQAFTHDLLRQAIYNQIPQNKRQFLHYKAAETLHSRAEPLVLAEHWFAAGETERAAQIWLETAEHFDDVLGLNREAVALFERVVASGTNPPMRHRAMISLSEQYRIEGRYSEAEAMLETVLAESISHYNRVDAWCRRAVVYHVQGRTSQARAAIQQAMDEAKDIDDPKILRNLVIAQVNTAETRDDYLEAARLAESVGLRDEIPNSAERVNWLACMGMTYNALGRHQDALEVYTEALELSQRLNSPYWKAFSINNLASTYSHLGRIHEMLVPLEEALALGEFASVIRYHLACAYQTSGRPAEALALAESVFELPSTTRLRARLWALLLELRDQLGPPHARHEAYQQLLGLVRASDSPIVRAIGLSALLHYSDGDSLAELRSLLEGLDLDQLPSPSREHLLKAIEHLD